MEQAEVRPIAYNDARDYLAVLESHGVLKRIRGASQEITMGSIAELASTRPDQPAVLFEEIPELDPRFRVLSNLTTGSQQGRLIFGVPTHLSEIDALRLWKDHLKTYRPVPPVEVSSGPVTEIQLDADEINLSTLPWPRWHKLDGGGYQTAAVCITRSRDGNTINLGCYRIMYLDDTRLFVYPGSGHHGAMIRNEYWAAGEACPIAISLGQDPSLLVASVTDRPWVESEYGYAGWLRGKPVEVMSGPVTGLPIPAASEIVLEGEMLPPESGEYPEGPFGEASGYYGGGVKMLPATRILGAVMRSDPILFAEPQGGYSVIGSRSVTVWDDLERLGVPGIVAVNNRWAMCIISLKQEHPGHAMRAAMGALGGIAGYHAHFVITVDEDINPFDLDQVMWAVATRCDPAEQVEVNRRIWSVALDPRLAPERKAAGDTTGSVAIIDACRPFHWRANFPATVRMDAGTRQRTEEEWGWAI